MSLCTIIAIQHSGWVFGYYEMLNVFLFYYVIVFIFLVSNIDFHQKSDNNN